MNIPPILFEDDTLIAFDKPSGLPVAGDRRDKVTDNLMDRVHAAMGRDIANAHRLDVDASGVLLCAKTKTAIDFVSGQFQSKTVVKKHLAMVVILPAERAMKVVAPLRTESGGLPASFQVDLALGVDEADAQRMRVAKRRGGKPSVTDFRILESFGRFVWLECRPLSGSRHQIRVHLAAIGAPVLNDPLYGDPEELLLLSGLKRRYKGRDEERPLIARLALHASELTFKHPVTREPQTIAAPLPHDFEIALKYLRKFTPRASAGQPLLPFNPRGRGARSVT